MPSPRPVFKKIQAAFVKEYGIDPGIPDDIRIFWALFGKPVAICIGLLVAILGVMWYYGVM